MPFEEVLVELDTVDLKRTTKFNVYMSMVELEYGLKQIVYTNRSESSDINKMKRINEVFPQRN